MYMLFAGEPNAATCPHSDWWRIEVGGIVWKSCHACTLTLCSLPGVDRCMHWPRPVWTTAPRTVARLHEAVADVGTMCETLTNNMCVLCGDSVCSDHMAAHTAQEHAEEGAMAVTLREQEAVAELLHQAASGAALAPFPDGQQGKEAV